MNNLHRGVWFVWLGVSYVLPFHCILFSVDVVGSENVFVFTLCYFFPCLVSSCVLVFRPRVLDLLVRVLFSYGTFFLALSFFGFLVSSSSFSSLWLLFLLVACVGAVDGLAQSSVLSMAAREGAVRSVMLGNAIAGLAVSALKICVRLALVADLRAASLIFTIICSFAMLVTMGLFYYFHRNEELEEDEEEQGGGGATSLHVMLSMRSVFPIPALCFVLFWSTLLVFPGLASEAGGGDSSGALIPAAWSSTLMLSAFNFGDFCGRLVGLMKPTQVDWKAVLGLIATRLLLCGTLVLLSSLRVIVDLVGLAALVVFGISGGWLASTLGGEAQNEHGKTATTSGALLTLAILLGLFGGSLTAFALNKLI